MKQTLAWLLALILMITMTGRGKEEAPEEPTPEITGQTTETQPIEQPDEPETPPAEEADIDALTAVTAANGATAGRTDVIRGGTNQDEAVLLPLNTRLTGQATAEGGLWYAFTTGAAENATYKTTLVHKTLGADVLNLQVYDAYGEAMPNAYSSPLQATQDGKASTLSLELPANTTYYVYIWSEAGENIDYSLTIRDPEEQKAGYSTAGSLLTPVDAAAGLEIAAGTNQDDVSLLPLDTDLSGKVSDGQGQWFAFTTNEIENATYEFTAVNKTPGTENLCLYVYDMYGETMPNPRCLPLWAKQDGKAVTLSLELPAKTTYFIYVWAYRDETTQYSLRIHGPEDPAEQEPLVFETPYEINSTQVMFKAESDVFIDEAAAKTALQPVAEIILAHPDSKILLAGTTATDGDQQHRVDLSNRRAASVKRLLVDAFGVPELQLVTIGLGFEADPFVRGQDRDANGNFIESEGAKNRRVVVLDVNDPIAQELLQK